MGLRVVRGQNEGLPLTLTVALTTGQHYRDACDFLMISSNTIYLLQSVPTTWRSYCLLLCALEILLLLGLLTYLLTYLMKVVQLFNLLLFWRIISTMRHVSGIFPVIFRVPFHSFWVVTLLLCQAMCYVRNDHDDDDDDDDVICCTTIVASRLYQRCAWEWEFPKSHGNGCGLWATNSNGTGLGMMSWECEWHCVYTKVLFLHNNVYWQLNNKHSLLTIIDRQNKEN